MTVVLLIVGLLATAAGFVTIGFGIPINAFSLGNTLIISGTVSVASGLVLIGLAAVLGQLRRLNAALGGKSLTRAAESVESLVPPTARMTPVPQPAAVTPARAPEPSLPELFAAEAQRGGPAAEPPLHFPDLPHRAPEPPRMAPEPPRMPDLPKMPEPPRAPEPRQQPEPRFPVTADGPGPLDWLRSSNKPKAAARQPAASATPSAPQPMPQPAEPPMVDVHDEAPLSPRSPQRQAMPPWPPLPPIPPLPQVAEPALEPKSGPPQSPPRPVEPAPRAEQPMPRATPQPPPPAEPAREKDGFDLVWPDRPSAAQPAAPAEPAARREPMPDMPLPPVPARPRDGKPAAGRGSAAPAKPAERGPAILKSGVIDGMPYTLYADGSIEAELPQGTVKFASVDALRAHLEKQS